MLNRFSFSTSKVGLAPGTVVFTGVQKLDVAQVKLIQYGPGGELEERVVEDVGTLRKPEPGAHGVTWINVYGLHDTELVESLCKEFGVHPLAIEDIVSVGGRPVLTEYDGFVFAGLRMLSLLDDGSIESEHISLMTGPGWVLSFQERVGDVFEPLRHRIRTSSTRIRSRGSNYLWYVLLDAVVDNYLLTLDDIGGRLDTLESAVWSDEPVDNVPARVQSLRDHLMTAGRAIRPLSEEVASFIVHNPDVIDEATRPFFHDLTDHLKQLVESVEHVRETLSSVMDGHLAMVSMRTNEVMKVLTIMASIFIPLTFIAGIYGMNFEYMPELGVRWGYTAVWGVMITAAGGMIMFFRRRGWM